MMLPEAEVVCGVQPSNNTFSKIAEQAGLVVRRWLQLDLMCRGFQALMHSF